MPLYYPDKYTNRVQTLTSNNTEESENSLEAPHLGEIKRMRTQCEPGASPFFARAGDEASMCRTNLRMAVQRKYDKTRLLPCESFPTLAISCRTSVVKDEEAGRFREVAGMSIIAVGCLRSAVDTSNVDSQVTTSSLNIKVSPEYKGGASPRRPRGSYATAIPSWMVNCIRLRYALYNVYILYVVHIH